MKGKWNVCVCEASVEWRKIEVLRIKPRPSATLHEMDSTVIEPGSPRQGADV